MGNQFSDRMRKIAEEAVNAASSTSKTAKTRTLNSAEKQRLAQAANTIRRSVQAGTPLREQGSRAFAAYAKQQQAREAAQAQRVADMDMDAYTAAVHRFMAQNRYTGPLLVDTLDRGYQNVTEQEIKPLLNGESTTPDESAYDYLTGGGREKLEAAVVDTDDFLKQFANAGYFDVEDNIKSGSTNLLSDAYIDQMLAQYRDAQEKQTAAFETGREDEKQTFINTLYGQNAKDGQTFIDLIGKIGETLPEGYSAKDVEDAIVDVTRKAGGAWGSMDSQTIVMDTLLAWDSAVNGTELMTFDELVKSPISDEEFAAEVLRLYRQAEGVRWEEKAVGQPYDAWIESLEGETAKRERIRELEQAAYSDPAFADRSSYTATEEDVSTQLDKTSVTIPYAADLARVMNSVFGDGDILEAGAGFVHAAADAGDVQWLADAAQAVLDFNLSKTVNGLAGSVAGALGADQAAQEMAVDSANMAGLLMDAMSNPIGMLIDHFANEDESVTLRGTNLNRDSFLQIMNNYVMGAYDNADDLDGATKLMFESGGWNMMTSDEKAVFSYYFNDPNDPDKNKALEYLNSKQSDLYRRRATANQRETELLATDPTTAGVQFLAEAPALALDVAAAPAKAIAALSGTDDPNAPWHDAANYRNFGAAARQTAIDEGNLGPVGGVLKVLDQTTTAARDVLFTMAIGNVFGRAIGGAGAAGASTAKTASGLTMAGSAASADLTATAGSDMSGWARLARAGATGLVEMATEKYSLDALLKEPASTWKYLLQNFLTEGSEELASSLGQTGIDYIVSKIDGSRTDLETAAKELEAAGYQNAWEMVLTDYITGAAMEFAVGGTTGAALSGFRAIPTVMERRKTGKQIKTANNVQNLLSVGQSMKEGTESRRLADLIAEEEQKRGKVSTSSLGQLYNALQSDVGKEYQDTVRQETVDAVAATISEKYAQTGESEKSPYDASTLAEGIIALAEDGKMLNGKNVPAGLKAYIHTHRSTKETLREFTAGGTAWTARLNERTLQLTEKHLTDSARIKGLTKSGEQSTAASGDTSVAAETVTDETKAGVSQLTHGKTSDGFSRAVSYIDAIGAKRQAELIGITRTGGGVEALVRSEDGAEETVPYDELDAVEDQNVATVLEYARLHTETTNEELQLIMSEVEKGEQAAQVISDVTSAYDAGAFGMQMPGAGELDAASTAGTEAGENTGAAEPAGVDMNKLYGKELQKISGDFPSAQNATPTAEETASSMQATGQKITALLRQAQDIIRGAGSSGAAATRVDEAVKEYADAAYDLQEALLTKGKAAVETINAYADSVVNALQAAEDAGVDVETAADEIIEEVIPYLEAAASAEETAAAGSDAAASGSELQFSARTPGEGAATAAGAENAQSTTSEARTQLMQAAYNLGRKAAEAQEAERRAGTQNRRRGSGTVSYMGNVGNTEDVSDSGSRQKLNTIRGRMSDQQNAAIDVLAQISRVTGVDVVLYESNAEEGEAIRTPNGWYDGGRNAVYVDLNSGASVGGEQLVTPAILRTAGHELTHWIENNSPDMYARLRQQVRQMLTERNQDYVRLVRSKMQNSSRGLSRAAAEAEVIAEACEMMLQDTQAIKRLAQRDAGLVGKILEFLKDFARRLKRALEGVTATSSEAQALMEVRDGVERYIDGLPETWDDALVEAAGNGKKRRKVEVKKGATADGGRQYSYAGRRSETRDGSLLEQAQELDWNGESNETIRQQTGWFKGMDGQWRYEIDDSQARIIEADAGRVLMLSELLEHPTLYEAYPELKNTPVIFADLPENTHGRAVGRGIMLNEKDFSIDGRVTTDSKSLKSTLLHEIQHQIQRIEGFATGSNQRYWQEKLNAGLRVNSNDAGIRKAEQTRREFFEKQSDEMKELIRRHNRLMLEMREQERRVLEAESVDEGEAARARVLQIMEQASELVDRAAQIDPESDPLWTYDMMTEAIREAKANSHPMNSMELYRMTAGEIEARDVESRIGLQEGQRRTIPPAHDENAVFVDGPFVKQYSDTGHSRQSDHLLTPSEYGRLRSNLNSQKYGNVFAKRPNGGVLVAMNNILVYTDRNGNPEYVAEVPDHDIWLVNDVQQLLIQLEGDGTDHETQRIILESVYGTEGAHFRSRGERTSVAGKDGKGARSNERGMGEGNRKEVPPEVTEYSDRTPAPSLRQTLAAMAVTPDMNETERYLLESYKKNASDLAELQEKIRSQAAILSIDSVSSDEKTQARERLKIFRTQARRIEQRLRTAERNEGFASLMRTSRRLVREVMSTSSEDESIKRIEEQLGSLRSELAAVRSDLDSMSADQRTQLVRSLFDPKTLNNGAKALKVSYSSSMSVKEIENRLAVMYAELYKGDAQSQQRYTEGLRELAGELLRSSRTMGTSETLEMLKEGIGTIRVTDAQLQELKANGVSMREFRRVVNPVVRISSGKDASDLTAAISGAEYFGTGGANGVQALFEGYENEGDAVIRLYELIRAERGNTTVEGMSEEQALQMAMADIIEQAALPYPDAAAVEAVSEAILGAAEVSQQVQNRLHELMKRVRTASNTAWAARMIRAKEQDAPRKVAEYYRKLEEQRRLMEVEEETSRIKEQLLADSEGKLTEMKKKLQEAWDDRQVMREISEENTRRRARIKTVVRRLDRLLRNETDRRHVPEGFKPVVEAMMGILIDGNDALHVFQGKGALNAAAAAYAQLSAQDGNDLNQMSAYYSEDIAATLEELQFLLTKHEKAKRSATPLDKLRWQGQCLEGILEIVDHIWHLSTQIDQTIINEKAASITQTAAGIVAEAEEKPDYRISTNPIARMLREGVEKTQLGNMSPVYFFRMLGIKGMDALNADITRAESQYARLWKAAEEYIRQQQERHGYWSWRDDEPLIFTTAQGQRVGGGKHSITLTKEQAMAIWATWKREHLRSALIYSSHLENGGFVFEGQKRVVGNREISDTKPHKLTMADFNTIDNYLTDQQKAYADALVGYMSTDMAAIGNQTSMQLYGIRKFKEGYYFPFKVQRDQLAQKSGAGASSAMDDNRIAHFGGSKRRVNQASNPLAIGDFTSTVAGHIEQMLLYGTFAVPIENMNKVLNAAYLAEDDSRMTTRLMIEQKYGKEAYSYLKRYLADLNGGVQRDSVENGKLLSLWKKSSVMASLSVAVQQPTSIIRAMMEVDPKYFVPLANHRDNVRWKDEYEQLKKFSGTAILKERGGIDMTGGRSGAAGLVGNMEDGYDIYRKVRLALGIGDAKGAERFKAAGRQWESAFGYFAGKADQVAWAYMWRAIKAETAAQHPRMDMNSEEFLQLASERFDEVMRLTQVYDSTLVRSQNMRSNTVHMKMLTAFMAEPTLTANMLMDAFQSRDKKKMVKATVNYLTATVVTAAAAALVKAGRDDDPDKTWLEKYLASISSSLGGWSGSLNPLNLLPGYRDLMSLLDGYDVERSDMSLVDDIVTELDKVMNGKYADDPLKGLENAGGTVANALGIPLKNIMRDLRSMYNTATGLLSPPRENSALVMANDALSDFSLRNIWEPDTSISAYYAKLYEAMRSGDADEERTLRDYIGISGKDDEDLQKGVRDVVKEKLLDGQITEEEAKAFLLDNGLADDARSAYEYVEKWVYSKETGSTDGFSMYNDFYAAVESGKNLRNVISAYKQLGVEASTLSRQITNKYEKQLIALYTTDHTAFANLQARLLSAYEALGYDRDEKLKDIKKWLE